MRSYAALLVFGIIGSTLPGAVCAGESKPLKFDFGAGAVAPGYIQVLPDMAYSRERGYGFEPGAKISAIDRGGDSLRGDFITGDAPFNFTARVPNEGNYR